MFFLPISARGLIRFLSITFQTQWIGSMSRSYPLPAFYSPQLLEKFWIVSSSIKISIIQWKSRCFTVTLQWWFDHTSLLQLLLCLAYPRLVLSWQGEMGLPFEILYKKNVSLYEGPFFWAPFSLHPPPIAVQLRPKAPELIYCNIVFFRC